MLRFVFLNAGFTHRLPMAVILAVSAGISGSASVRGADLPTVPDQSYRWQLDPLRKAITWDVARESQMPHKDRIELSGKHTAAILTYQVDAQRQLELVRTLIWPTLRIHPNDTRGFLKLDFSRTQAPRGREPLSAEGLTCFEPTVMVNKQPVTPAVRRIRFENGLMTITSDLGNRLDLEQTLTPGMESAGYFESWRICARSPATACRVEITPLAYSSKLHYHFIDKGVYRYGQPRPEPSTRDGNYRISINCPGVSADVAAGATGLVCSAGVSFDARDANDPIPAPDVERQIAGRAAFATNLFADLRLECPDPVLKTLFDYSKIRACDSICETKGGPLHAPGGGDYYAAIWANDTIEYVGPFFPFLGYEYGNKATLNALDHYARYLNPEYNPLPSSIIAEGTDIWARRLKPDGLPDAFGDCGDAAMLAYGGSRFLLALGDKQAALQHWPLIAWSLEYCDRQRTPEGIIASASDELEGRFSSGKYNLNTSMLTYGGLQSSADLADELGKTELARNYRKRAQALRQAVARYFEADVAGFSTYQYYEGCKELRAWICMPLTMGIFERKEGTIAALFSPRLWTANGLLSAENSTTYWDRSTLYALRGAFCAGKADVVLPRLQEFSRQRLLGEHVPYVIEAVPEGNGRHLSAESALYCRIFTEGLFGVTPRGLRKFTLQPSLPSAWSHVALRRVKAFHSTFDVEISREGYSRLRIRILPDHAKPIEKTVREGEVAAIELGRVARK